jgi:uncharacterized protein YjbK
MITQEIERKYMLTEPEYNMWSSRLVEHTTDNVIQINYYYDDDSYSLCGSDETLRIRQIGNQLTREFKFNKRDIDGVRICDEQTTGISEFPLQLSVRGKIYRLIGSMITIRKNIQIDNATVSLDQSLYFGAVDYELEIEYGNCREETNPIIKMIETQCNCPSTHGKYQRFISKLRELMMSDNRTFCLCQVKNTAFGHENIQHPLNTEM